MNFIMFLEFQVFTRIWKNRRDKIIAKQSQTEIIVNWALLHESDFGHNAPFPKTWVMQCAQKLVCQSQTFCLKVGT